MINFIRKIAFPGALMFLLSACGGGWSQSEKDSFMKSCKNFGEMDCDCALKAAMEKFPSADDFKTKGAEDPKLAEEIYKNCIK